MAAPIALRSDFDGCGLCSLARRSKDAAQTRVCWLLPLVVEFSLNVGAQNSLAWRGMIVAVISRIVDRMISFLVAVRGVLVPQWV